MTQDEIIEMAKQAGAMFDHMTWVERDLLPVFERFAKLVAEKERTWVGLTDDEIDKKLKIYEQDYDWISFAKAIEAKLKQKNGFAEEKKT